MSSWAGWLLAINMLALAAALFYIVKQRLKSDAAEAAPPRDWAVEDLLACILSALAYFSGLSGLSLLIMNQLSGWLLSLSTILLVAAMFYIIDPKLRRISAEFAKKQQGYIEELDKILEWDETGDY